MAKPKRLLIANRGEVAMRIVRACRAMGVETVAVHSEADAHQMHLRFADQTVCIGPAPAAESYLNDFQIVSAMDVTQCDAVHPGYGFLAENPAFAEKVRNSGYKFVGPSPELIRDMGDKVAARAIAAQHGIPLVPGSPGVVRTPEEASASAAEIGYPVILKASAGGGGRGTRVVWSEADMNSAFHTASTEAEKAFGDDRLYVEKFLEKPRHIEFQVASDGRKAVHFGDRDCSVQRRRQKLVEEGPAWDIPQATLEDMRTRCAELCAAIGYEGVGTVEMLYEKGEFYFIEMNTRIQVEHCVSEMITGRDLVELQLRIAFEDELPLKQSDIDIRGHAVECRINAEHPETFVPSPGRVKMLHQPAGPWVRFDSYLYTRSEIPPHYDSLVGKLITWGEDRNMALARMRTALEELLVEGIHTTQGLHRRLLEDPTFQSGAVHINFLENEFLAAKH